MHRWEWCAVWGGGRRTRLWALLPADTRGYHQWHRGYQRIPVTQGRQSWSTTRQGRRTPLDTSGRRTPRETPVRWGLPEGEWVHHPCKQLWSDWVILKGSDWIALKWKCFSRRFRWLTVNEKWTPILRELRWWCFTSLVITYGFVASERAPLKRKPWCPHICVVVHFKYFELNFYLRWLRYKMWWMTFELGLIEFFPSLKKGSKSGVARQNLKEKVNWILN